MKIDLYINGKNLDVYNQDLTWNWTNIRFSDGIKDAYSTDITIPKTNNNMSVLKVSGLLDSVSQLYGTQLTPASMGVGGSIMDVYVEMCSITNNEIKICLYQRTLPDKVFGKKLREFVHDDWETIFVWSMNTLTAYEQSFPPYNYGSSFNRALAMRHPAKKLNDVIGDINTALQDFTLPFVEDDLMLLAAHKKVCPQNTRQVIEFGCTLENNDIVLAGGQHITNDLEGWDGNSKILESTVNEITFNRDCTAVIHGYVSWGKKTTTGNQTFMVSLLRNGQFEYGWQFNTYSNRANGVVDGTITVQIHEGDTFSLELVCPTSPNNPQNKLEMLAGVLDIEYADYEITDDDYGTDLVYCHRHPTLYQWSPDDELISHYFDGRTENFRIYYANGSVQNIPMEFPWRGFSYIGYYCNIGDITLKDLFWGLCWLYQKKPIREMRKMFLVGAQESAVLNEAVITEIRPSSDKLGKVTAVEWSGGKGKTTLTNIPSTWLADEVVLHVSPFTYAEKIAGGLARINQYTITSSYNEDGETVWNVEYHETEGAVIVRLGEYGRLGRTGLIPPPPISTMGIEKLSQCVEVTISSHDEGIKDVDYLFLDGRKFLVVEGSTSLNSGVSTLTALLIPS